MRARTTGPLPPSMCCGFCKNPPRFTWRRPRRRLVRRRQGPVVRGQIAGGGSAVGVVFSNRRWMQIPCGHMWNEVFAHAGDLRMATAERHCAVAEEAGTRRPVVGEAAGALDVAFLTSCITPCGVSRLHERTQELRAGGKATRRTRLGRAPDGR